MYINGSSLATQNHIFQKGVKPPKSSFNFGDMLEDALDPLGIFRKSKKTVEHFVDTTDHILNKGINTAEDLADLGSDLVHEGGKAAKDGLEGLEKMIQMMTKILPVILIGGVVLTVLK